MKKLIIIFQILIFVSQSVYADTLSTPVSTASTEIIIPKMPKNYKLPDMQLLDSVAFYNKYKDQQGKRITVQGYAGRFGSTLGDEFKQKIFEIESQNRDQVEIILSLTSTLEDAKILKHRMSLVGRKMVIVEIPDEVQKEILERAAAQSAGGLKELWWDTKHKANKLMHPVDTASNSIKIIKNQFVKPNRHDASIVSISIATTLVTSAALLFVPGVDISLALTMAVSRILIGGTAITFRRTISNIYRANITNDLSVTQTWRQILMRTSTLGLGMGELYYGIGSTHGEYGLTQEQVFSNTMTSGVIDTAAAVERDRRLSQTANYRMFLYSLIIGSAISTIGITGLVGPVVMDHAFLQISSLQTFSLVMFSGLYLSYKYFSDRVEMIAQKDLKKYLLDRYKRLINFRTLKREREAREQNEIIENKNRLAEAISDLTLNRARTRAALNPVCSRLFN